jgi:hypothetical protein
MYNSIISHLSSVTHLITHLSTSHLSSLIYHLLHHITPHHITSHHITSHHTHHTTSHHITSTHPARGQDKGVGGQARDSEKGGESLISHLSSLISHLSSLISHLSSLIHLSSPTSPICQFSQLAEENKLRSDAAKKHKKEVKDKDREIAELKEKVYKYFQVNTNDL